MKVSSADIQNMWASLWNTDKLHGNVGSLLVYHSLALSLSKSRQMKVKFERHDEWPRQAITIDLRPGQIAFGDVVSPMFHLFADTAPKESTYDLRPKPSQDRFWVHHSWDNGRSVTGLVGSYGIVVLATTSELRVYCNDSFGEPTFRDLIVSLQTRDSEDDTWKSPTWINKAEEHDDWQRSFGDWV